MHPNAYLRRFWRQSELHGVFVAMSFGPTYEARFREIYEPAINAITVGGRPLDAIRVDQSKTGDSILTDILEGIAHAMVVLADVSSMGWHSKTGQSHRNGNVMYEAGLALACRQPSEVLLVRDDHEKFLFDVSSIPHKTIDFQSTEFARAEISEAVIDRIRETEKIHDARVDLAAARIGPHALMVLREIALGGGRMEMRVDHPEAYLQLLDEGIVELNRSRPFQGENPTYGATAFGRDVVNRLFQNASA